MYKYHRLFNSFQQKMVKRFRQTAILLFGTLSGSAYCFVNNNHSDSAPWEKANIISWRNNYSKSSSSILSTSAWGNEDHVPGSGRIAEPSKATVNGRRSYSTDADAFFQKFCRIPSPLISHDSLDRMMTKNVATSTQTADKDLPTHEKQNESVSSKILVIGDVHGCLNELKCLVTTAEKAHNENKPFAAVILVGDLCNKGPQSAETIQFVRKNQESNWFSVRGNHDNSALAAALGDETKRPRGSRKYDWVDSLSDDDVEWMSNLPYTITIPASLLEEDLASSPKQDVIVVHGGLIPGINLEDQSIETMTTIRDVVVEKNESQSDIADKHVTYKYYKPSDDGKPKAWAQAWMGPQQIVFGHDAKRGLQKEAFALGLDSGVCYGKKLTGVILPERLLVSTDAEKVHCPIKG